ncbi:conserved exported protein of unknown function [Rhodovastum atsumiense]|uniref:Uncharacterized protein n=1 Tax=Rhodovastum atsumiense TaxID=504468 RepID=A0A5M6IPY5_9PROT|nr:hypothetical protein [Rhodovastum atsumiense]KAA5610321.1 hypothetical protein F1189_19610 [Rhodovastum atsumiense]CAH2600941.1 conserved exported protein of unknown function [Rhodovastum atsumiense]
MWWLLLVLFSGPALAQPADCAAIPVGPPVSFDVYVEAPRRPGPYPSLPRTGVAVGVTDVPAFGTRCVAPPVPPGDVLRGPPARGDLLRGGGPRDLLQGPVRPDLR